MKFLIDAQLPPRLAIWLNQTFSVSATHVIEIEQVATDDKDIFFYAREHEYVIVTKDDDFLDLVAYHGLPPKILFVTCGNVTNQRLTKIFSAQFKNALELLAQAMPVVEIG